MQKAIIFDIKQFAVHDGPGIRTTVFFKGCPLQCLWCHNPESRSREIQSWIKSKEVNGKKIDAREVIGKEYTVDELVNVLLKDAMVWEESGGGVTISGGEPFLQEDFLFELLKSLHAEGIHTAVDTCGYFNSNMLSGFLPLIDLFLYDIKHYNNSKHEEYTGVGNQLILDNLKFILENKKKVWIRIPIIPSFNDSDEDLLSYIKLIGNFIGKPEQVNLLPYHNIASNKYDRLKMENKMHHRSSLSKDDLKLKAAAFENAGFKTIIGG